VSGGTIKLSAKTVLQNNQVTIPANATMDVSLNLLPTDNTPAAAPSTYGLDARNATYTMPATWIFTCKNNTCEVTETGPASCSVYGTDMAFAYLPATPIAFNAALNYILVPWTNNVSEFEVKSVKSPFF